MRIKERYLILENSSILKASFEFEAIDDTLLSFFSFFPKIRLSNTNLERFYSSFEIKDGIVKSIIKKYEGESIYSENAIVVPSIKNWAAVKDSNTGHGIVIFFPDEVAQIFIQNEKSYLTIPASCIREKLIPKGKKGCVELYMIPFNGDPENTVNKYSSNLKIESNLPRETVSPTGGTIASTKELVLWADVAERDILREEPYPERPLDKIKIAGAKGETESFQLAVFGKKSMPRNRLENMAFSFSDLKQMNGKAELPARNISYGHIEYLNVKYPSPGGNSWSGESPDRIEENR